MEDLRDSIVAMELGKFDTEKLIALRGIAPTTEELPKLKAFDGDLSKLDEVCVGSAPQLFLFPSCESHVEQICAVLFCDRGSDREDRAYFGWCNSAQCQ